MGILDDELDRLTGKRTVRIDPEEAMVLDWVLTLHTFDDATNTWLLGVVQRAWREQAGRAIINPAEGTLRVTSDELEQLLVLVPITFRFGTKDAGYSLKCKLFTALYTPLEMGTKETDNATDDTESADADQTHYPPADSTDSHP